MFVVWLAGPFVHSLVLYLASSKTLFKTFQQRSTDTSTSLFSLNSLTQKLKLLFQYLSLIFPTKTISTCIFNGPGSYMTGEFPFFKECILTIISRGGIQFLHSHLRGRGKGRWGKGGGGPSKWERMQTRGKGGVYINANIRI